MALRVPEPVAPVHALLSLLGGDGAGNGSSGIAHNRVDIFPCPLARRGVDTAALSRTLVSLTQALVKFDRDPSTRSSTAPPVRKLFRAALDPASSEALASSPALWTSFLAFELAELERARLSAAAKSVDAAASRVRDVYLQGLVRLPWHKDYMMLAFSPKVRDVMGDATLYDVTEILREKDLRCCCELPERPVVDSGVPDEDGDGDAVE